MAADQDTPSIPPASDPPTPWRLSTLIAALIALAVALIFARDTATTILIFMVMLVALVVAHELGHFFMAKLFGVYVEEFGVGFPPRLWGKRIGETEYTINALPIGGFVRLRGEEDPSAPRSLASTPRWQRFIILAAGAVVNLILPIFLFAVAFMWPHEESVGRAVVAGVTTNSPAAEAGLQQGDIIYSIGGRSAKNVAEAGRYIRLNLGQDTEITVKRGELFETVSVEPRWSPPTGEGPTGIKISSQYPFTETVSLPPWEAIPQGARATLDSLILARNEVISWFRGSSGPQFAGPVAIAQTTGEVREEGGAPPLFELAALLSINLGVINLLPLPMLDGGRVFFLLIEVVRGGKRIAPEKEAIVHMVGFALFMALAVVVTFADISRIVSGDSLFR